MKVKKPGTDQRVELKVYADGQPLTEWYLPSDTPRDNLNTVECFVPVKPNQVIHVAGVFTGTCHHSSYDLVIDGSFLTSRKTYGNNNGSMNLVKRDIMLDDPMDCPLPKGRKPESCPTKIYEGKLSVRKLTAHDIGTLGQREQELEGAKRPGVGSIEVVVSMTQVMEEQYIDTEWDIQVQGWRRRRRVKVRPSGITPDHTLDLIRNGKGAVGDKQSLRHRRDWEGTRVGTKPWARLIFYYRSKEDIGLAGCIPINDEEHALEPHQGTFTWGLPPKAKGKKGKREAEAQRQANKSGPSSESDIAVDEGDADVAHDAEQPLAEIAPGSIGGQPNSKKTSSRPKGTKFKPATARKGKVPTNVSEDSEFSDALQGYHHEDREASDRAGGDQNHGQDLSPQDEGEGTLAEYGADGSGSWSFVALEGGGEPQQQACNTPDKAETAPSTKETVDQSWSFDVLGQFQSSKATCEVSKSSGRDVGGHRANAGTPNSLTTFNFDVLPHPAATSPYKDTDEISVDPDQILDASSSELSSKRAAAIAVKDFLVTGLRNHKHVSIGIGDKENLPSKQTRRSSASSHAAAKRQVPDNIMAAGRPARNTSFINNSGDNGASVNYRSSVPSEADIIAYIGDRSATIDEISRQFLAPEPQEHCIAHWEWLEADRECKARIMAVVGKDGQDRVRLKPQFTNSERESSIIFASTENNDETNIPEQTGLTPSALPAAQKVKQEEPFDDSPLLATPPSPQTGTMAPSTSSSAPNTASSAFKRGQSMSMTPGVAAKKARSKVSAPNTTNSTLKRSPSMSMTPEFDTKKARAQTPLELEIAEKEKEVEKIKAVIAAEKAKAAAKAARKAERAEKRRRKEEAKKADEDRAKMAEVDKQREANLQELAKLKAYTAESSSSEESSVEEASSGED